eukprot:jgi/Ulvmu1/11607/UM008_0008.1
MQQGMAGGDRDKQQSVAEQRAQENAILARAVAIKRKREGHLDPDLYTIPLQRRYTHWNHLLNECKWMSIDILNERRWKKRMAFIIAHEALHARKNLRKVYIEGNGVYEGIASPPQSSRRGRASRESIIKTEPSTQLGGSNGASRSTSALTAAGRSIKGSPGHCQSVPVVACTEFLVYDWSLLRSALKYVVRTAEDAYVKRIVEALAATEELEAAQSEYLIRVHSAKSAMPGTAAPDGLLTNGERVSGLARQSSMADGSWPGSRRQWPTGRPGVSRTISMDPSQAAQAAAAARRPDLAGVSHEDDSLMMCLIAEFGESFRLVADVFNSLRRLDGTYLHHRVVANRDKSRAVNKEDARRVLRHMLPCSGTTVAKYCQAIKPSAVRLAQEQQQDSDVANNKRGEFAMHGIQAHKSQQEFLQQALVPFNGTVPSPTELLRWRRCGGGLPGVGGMPAGPGAPGGGGVGPPFPPDGRGGGAAAQQPQAPPGPAMAGPPAPAVSGGISRDGSMLGMHAPRGPQGQAAVQLPPGVDDPAMQMGPQGMMGPPHGAGTPPPGATGHPQFPHMEGVHASQPQIQQQVPRRPSGHRGAPHPGMHPGMQMMPPDPMAGGAPMGIMHVPQGHQHHHLAPMHPNMPPGAGQQPPGR